MFTIFRCPYCKGSIRYTPPADKMKQIEADPNAKRPFLFGITCHHCPKTLILNPETGEAVEFNVELVTRMRIGTLFFHDSTLMTGPDIYAKNQQQVEDLTYEADRILASGDVERAEKKFREALTFRRNDAKTWHNIGYCRLQLRDLAAAIDCFRTALNYDRSLLETWNNLGTCLIMIQKLDEAEKCFDDALAVNDEYPRFYLGKANIANLRGDSRQARKFLKKALSIDRSYEPARKALEAISR